MTTPLPAPDPVAIALQSMTTGDAVEFQGIDLDSGAVVTVAVTQVSPSPPGRKPERLCAIGLVLTISLERIADAH